jgi:hypothetical protein
MVERLRNSVEHLEPPTCANCHVDMLWVHSLLLPGHPETIGHFFQCPNCNSVGEVRSPVAADEHRPTPPPKFSRRARVSRRAAA